jgi:hypothetical protein
MKKESGRTKLPFHDGDVENSTPAHVNVKKKKKERGVPTAVEVCVLIEFLSVRMK